MDLYRITPQQYLQDFSGRGASYQDGSRWNLPGHPALYFGCSPSVAMLEMANYLPSPRLVPKTYRLGKYTIADISYDEWFVDKLPTDWNTYSHSVSTQKLGSAWLKQNEKVILLLPSAAVPAGLEKIVLFNPLHPDAKKIQLVETIETIYNPRMFKGL